MRRMRLAPLEHRRQTRRVRLGHLVILEREVGDPAVGDHGLAEGGAAGFGNACGVERFKLV